MPKPEDDGKTHINIYSKGGTRLGRMLTNFACLRLKLFRGMMPKYLTERRK